MVGESATTGGPEGPLGVAWMCESKRRSSTCIMASQGSNFMTAKGAGSGDTAWPPEMGFGSAEPSTPRFTDAGWAEMTLNPPCGLDPVRWTVGLSCLPCRKRLLKLGRTHVTDGRV